MHRSRLRLFLPIALLVVALALVAGLAACGSSKGGGKSADEILNSAFSGKHKQANSGKLNLSASVDLNGAPNVNGPIKGSLSGAFQSNGKGQFPSLDLKVDASAQGQSFQAGLITTGSQAFVNYKGTDYEVPANLYNQFKQGYQQAQQQAATTTTSTVTNPLAALGINPRNWLKDATVQDDTDVAGTKTYHVSASIDVSKMVDDLAQAQQNNPALGGVTGGQLQQLSDQAKKDIANSVKKATFNVYVGADDDIIRKLVINVEIALPANLQAQANGLKGGTFNLSVTLSDLNKTQTITAPANAKPLDDLLTQFGIPAGSLSQLGSGGLSGGGLPGTTTPSGGTTTTPSGGTTTTPSNAQTKAYLDCIQAAKTSSDLQACNNLLK